MFEQFQIQYILLPRDKHTSLILSKAKYRFSHTCFHFQKDRYLQQRPSRQLADQFYLIRQLYFKKLVLASQFLFAISFGYYCQLKYIVLYIENICLIVVTCRGLSSSRCEQNLNKILCNCIKLSPPPSYYVLPAAFPPKFLFARSSGCSQEVFTGFDRTGNASCREKEYQKVEQ
ncbi:Hypothetical_protein [Hexamita inflata]|uniref:Hypothetical_protein n=1 Tax=Hexamita inflata TaxID=28002 RepID=A0AA86N4Y5_9EUKA|nr:Hypothetical protein HINF_LOCUS518 [Hexamita inflata]